ncbi:MAG: DUF4442 domain-containing protein [Bacteroidota bacterium]
MSFYQKIAAVGSKYIEKSTLFRWGFNWSPMYMRSTGKITTVSKDLMQIQIKLPISFKNRNYVGSIFGGSLFSSVDPIPMVQLINLLGDDYVVWDKHAEIFFKHPAREDLYAEYHYSPEELEELKNRVAKEQEIETVKTTQLTNKAKDKVFCEVRKTIYIADKTYFKQKRKRRKEQV